MAHQAEIQWQMDVIARALQRARKRGIQVTGKGRRKSDGRHVYTVSSGSEPERWHLVLVLANRLCVIAWLADMGGYVCIGWWFMSGSPPNAGRRA